QKHALSVPGRLVGRQYARSILGRRERLSGRALLGHGGWAMLGPMTKRARMVKWVAASAALTAGVAMWMSDAPEPGAAATLENQVWIDKVPANDRDLITHMLLLDHRKARHLGVIGRSSQWRHNLEVMRWNRE